MRQKVKSIPIDPQKFKFDDEIIVSSLQKYCYLTGADFEDSICQGFFSDGYVTEELRPGLKLILYDKNKYDPRMRFTILHEIGHIRLKHKKHGPREELEANFFAAQTIAPNVLVREAKRRGYQVTSDLLTSAFWISQECAERKLQFLCKYPETTPNEMDTKILNAYHQYLLFCLPMRTRCNIDIEVE